MHQRLLSNGLLLTALVVGTFGIRMFAHALSTQKRPSENARGCSVTKPSDHPFVPPKPYSAFHGKDEFVYGTPGLWTIVDPKHWHVHSGGKLPFFRQGFDWRKEGRPRLTVVARRLDGEGPLVWNALVGSGSQEGLGVEGMFMVTGIDVPSSGCLEITARYAAVEPDIQTLTYTVWVSN
jgi:hypothetical protein